MHWKTTKEKQENIALTLIKFCAPLIFSGILQQLYSWADAFIVGNVAGETALAAIGATYAVINLYLMAITGFTLGLSILFAHKFGSKKEAEITELLSSFSFLFGVLFTLLSGVGILLSAPLLTAMNTTPETISMATKYLQVILFGIPFLAVYNVYAAALRGVGNSKAPFLSVLCSSVINVLLDLLFVALFHWSVVGAALATVISQIIMMLYLILYSRKKYSYMHLKKVRTTYDRSLQKQGFRLGTPPMVQSCITAVGNLTLQNFMNGFGTLTVAAITTAYRVDSIILLPIINLGSGISTIVAQHYGAGKKKQIPRIVAVGTAIMTAVSILLTLLVIKTGTFLIAMFGLGPESTAIGGEFFSRIAVFYLLFGIATALRGYLEGLGDVLYSSIAGVISLLSRIFFSYAFVAVSGNMIIVYAEAGSWGVLLFLYVLRMIWKSRSNDSSRLPST